MNLIKMAPGIACGIALLLGLVLGLVGCGSESLNAKEGQPNGKLVITGSSTLAPLISEIGKRFETLHPKVRVDVQSGGSSRGIADVRRGVADIGMASRQLKNQESELTPHTIARDGVCLIVHSDNPIKSLSDAEVTAIYRNEINNWNEMGGSDAPIVVLNKAEGRATLEVFLAHFKLDSPEIQADVIVGDNEQGVKTITGNVNAIGYVSIGTAEYDKRSGAPIRLLPCREVEATLKNVSDGKFPIVRPLILVTKNQPAGLARLFIEFCQSTEVHDLIEAQYFVPVAH